MNIYWIFVCLLSKKVNLFIIPVMTVSTEKVQVFLK